VVVAAIVAGCVWAGLWQLRRLDERKASNARVVQRGADVADLPPEGFTGSAASLEFRRVRATGTFDASREFLARFRTRDGAPGYEVVTPFNTTGGTLLVDRGWIPLGLGDRWPVADALPPPGTVTVEGLLSPPEGGGARIERRSGRPAVVGAIDPVGLRDLAFSAPVYRLHLLADRGATAAAAFPVPVAAPDLGEGPHFSYAVQWFCFATVGAVGWLLLLRRRGPLRPTAAGAR
jgi:cytochrome oxidase assembly protein ShyY1